MSENDTTFLSIVGDGLRPSNFDVRDLSEVLVGIEDLVKSMDQRAGQDAKICLESISEGSVKLKLVSTAMGLLASTLPLVAQAVHSRETESLPAEARKSLHRLVGIVNKKDVSILLPGNYESPVFIDSETQVNVPRPIRGPSEIVAKVYRAGGKNPKGMFESPAGGFLYLDLSEAQAVVCGKNLYSRMRIKGVGTWDSETNSLIDFKPESVVPMPEHEREEAISRLGAIFANIDMSRLEDIRREGGIL